MKQPSTEEWLADKKETSTKRKSSRPHHLDDFVTHPAPKSWAGSMSLEGEDALSARISILLFAP